MSFRQSRGYKVLLYGLTIACLGGAGYLGYRTFFSTPTLESFVKSAETAYEKGLKAYEAKNWGEAVTRFDEARILTEKAKETLDNQVKEQSIPPDDVNPVLARILWVRARAIRDHAYAKGHTDGTPIAEIQDPQYKESYRSFIRIPDPEARNQALGALRELATINTDGDILKEALRVELLQNQIAWSRAEPLLRKAVERDPKDGRSQYYLARYEFDQPQPNGLPLAPERKTLDDVNRARTRLETAKQAGASYWRTVGLEAELMNWPLLPATLKVRKLKPETQAAAEKALDTLLFDAQSGAVLAAGRGDKFTDVGRADIWGMGTILTIGMDRATADARKPGGNNDRVKQVTRAALDLAKKVAGDPALQGFLPDVLHTLSVVAAEAQPFISPSDPAGWKEYLTSVEGLVAKAEPGRTRASTQLQLAKIAFQDASIAARAGDMARTKELMAQGLKRAEEGLEVAVAANQTLEIVDLHAYIALRKLDMAARIETIEPHIAKLREVDNPRIKAVADFLEARLAERQGKLDKARKLLDHLAENTNHPDLAFQANVLLAGINVATRDSEKAKLALAAVEKGLQPGSDIDPMSREFANGLLGGMDGVLLLQVMANIQVALKAAEQYQIANPGQAIPFQQVASTEATARKQLDRLRKHTPQHRAGHLFFAEYEAATSRLKDARERMKALTEIYPTSIQVLRLRCSLDALPDDHISGPVRFTPEGTKVADKLIDDYISNFPTEAKAGRLFKAEWYVRTNRAKEAVAYIRNPQNFPTRDTSAERVLAIALDRAGQKEEARKILSQLPNDSSLDAALIQSTVDRQSRDQQLRAALDRYDNQGTFRLQEGLLMLSEGKHEEAIKSLSSAIEFTGVSLTAKQALLHSLLSYAFVEPLKARDAAIRILVDHPTEANLYLAAADAALILDDVGSPSDNWEQVKTAYAAMNRWRDVAAKAGTKPIDLSLTRARFHALAGNPDQAKSDAAAITKTDEGRTHIPTLLFIAELHLQQPINTGTVRACLDVIAQKSAMVGVQFLPAGSWRDYVAAVIQNAAINAQVPYYEARLKELAGDRAGAIAIYEKLVSANPRNPAANGALIASLSAAGRDADALVRAQDWLAAVPEDGRALIQMVRLLTVTGKKPEAVKMADDFVTWNLVEGKKRIAQITPPPSPDEAAKIIEAVRINCVFTGAVGFYQAKAYDECRTRLDEILKARPTDTTVLQLKGDMAIHQKDWDGAVAAYTAILKVRPRDFIAGNNVAYVLAENKNDPAAALAIIEEIRMGRGALRPIAPERLPADFLDTVGVVYTKLNRADKYPEMLAIFEAATRRYNTDPRMFLYLGTAQAATGDRGKALENLDNATRLAGLKNNGLPDQQNKKVLEAAEAARQRMRG